MWSIKKQLQYSIQQYFKKSHHHSGSAMQNWIQPVLVAKWKANHTFNTVMYWRLTAKNERAALGLENL